MTKIFRIVRSDIRSFSVSSFAIVMSVGIISIGLDLHEFKGLAKFLFWLNGILYIFLSGSLFLKLILFFRKTLLDLKDHNKGSGFFTTVAASGILGSQFILIRHDVHAGLILYFVSLVLWVLIVYYFLFSVIIRPVKPSLNKGIDGMWLLLIVSTESIAILGSLLYFNSVFSNDLGAVIHLSFYLLGNIFYFIVITLIFYRLAFLQVNLSDIEPPYWINMGAAAISTLAGAEVLSNCSNSLLIQSLSTFIKAGTLTLWAFATWWIPLIIIFGVWRHLIKKVPFSYRNQYWAMIFPLGMYATCTFKIERALGFSTVIPLSQMFLVFSLIALIVVSVGLIKNRLARFISAVRSNTHIPG